MHENDRFCEKYVMGVRSFIRFAKNHMGQKNETRCPCCDCLNIDVRNIDEVEDHLFLKGFCTTYTRWIYHGECSERLVYGSANFDVDDVDEEITDNEEDNGDEMHDMLEDIHRETFIDTSGPFDSSLGDSTIIVGGGEKKSFEKLLSEAERELYPNCKKFSSLDFLVKFLHLKVINHWSDKSLNMLLELLKEDFLNGETLPK